MGGFTALPMHERQTLLENLASRIVAVSAPGTTLADELAAIVERRGRAVSRASMDGLHNPDAIRRRRGPQQGYVEDAFPTSPEGIAPACYIAAMLAALAAPACASHLNGRHPEDQ